MDNPSLVFMLSGKRKSGKDFLADYLKGENKMFFLVVRLLKNYFKKDKDSPRDVDNISEIRITELVKHNG